MFRLFYYFKAVWYTLGGASAHCEYHMYALLLWLPLPGVYFVTSPEQSDIYISGESRFVFA